jgi:uncharacterized iron-regulated membrane protein
MEHIQSKGATAPTNRFYFVAWRWHFYAGLYVIPFLSMLAITGVTMLWISHMSGLSGERGSVLPEGRALSPSALQASVSEAFPGAVLSQYVSPLGADRVAVLKLTAGEQDIAAVMNPYSGAVIDSFAWGGGWYDFLTDIHGSLLIGTTGDRLIEIAASLGMVMVASGIYLHWPRNGTSWAQVLVPRPGARGRSFWKSLHGAVGFWMALVMVVFLVSGLSWSGIWGEKIVQAWSTFPAEKWDAVPLSDATHADMNHGATKEVPWAFEQTPMPESGSGAGAAGVAVPVTLDGVAAFADGLGFQGRYQISLPGDDKGVWTISHDSMSNDGPNPMRDRTIHIDQYSGKVLADVGYADYSAYARMMAVGVAFHEGDLGLWNLVLNTLFCGAIILMSVSGIVMWWLRRPAGAGRLVAPPRQADLGLWKTASLLVVAVGIAFPLAGLTLLAAVLVDALVLRYLPGFRRVLS